MFDSNYDLCYVNTIAWSDILTGVDATTTYKLSDPSQPARQCKCILLSKVFLLQNYCNYSNVI